MGAYISESNVSANFTIGNDSATIHEAALSGYMVVILAVLMITLVVVVVAGNALVILAFIVDKSLRNQSNYFFLNLAISDFLVGAFCIPVYIPYNLTGRWVLGRGLCKLWLIMDYLLCTASVFNIVLISYDRFLSVTRAVKYRAQQSMTRHAVVKMVAVWVLAFLLYGPAIIFWELVMGKSIVPGDKCFAEFYCTWYFLLSASTFEFFTPFISVAFFNFSIYLNIHQRNKSRVIRKEDLSPSSSGEPSCGHTFMQRKKFPSCSRRSKLLQSQDLAGAPSRTSQGSRLSRDKKIAKSLAIIVCIFGICWAPYTLLMIIQAACKRQCVEEHWYEITFWLLWLNSGINPFLYPLCHSSFRRAFAKILCPKRQSVQPHTETQSC
uniref:G-protein coupled receptors family 1 profile domain-containing protein n=1 Tax=Esox lucius TaxID=8010 RepID=A0AAY5KLN2_ESOLU